MARTRFPRALTRVRPLGAPAGARAAADPAYVPEDLESAPEMPDTDEESGSDGGAGPAAPVAPAARASRTGARARGGARAGGVEWGTRPLLRRLRAFTGKRGHTLRVGRRKWKVKDVWEKFVGPGTLQLICDETNRYAAQVHEMERPRFVRRDHPWPPKFLEAWQPLHVPELKVFLGLTFGFGLVRVPKLRDYWCGQTLFYDFPRLATHMARDRFFAIKRCLHFVDNNDDSVDRTDPFNKVRPLLERLRKTSKELYHPGEFLSLDEMMQCCHNRSCPGVVFRPPKKKTNGIKIWAICEAKTGYCCAFRVAYKKGPVISDIVVSLAGDLIGDYHRIFMDNLFTKPKVFETLLETPQYACGTWRSNFGVPMDLKPVQNKDLAKGTYRWRTANGTLLGVVWRDSKVLNLLSTCHGETEAGCVPRRVSGQHARDQIPAPQLAIDYNMYMGGVGECDALRASYTTARPSTRWYLALFYWWLDMTSIQSMVVYRNMGTKITHANFIHELAVALIEDGTGLEGLNFTESRKRRRTTPPPPGGPSLPRGMHLVVRHDARHRCYRCYHKYKCEKRTHLSCENCGRHLCARCFHPYHHEPELWK